MLPNIISMIMLKNMTTPNIETLILIGFNVFILFLVCYLEWVNKEHNKTKLDFLNLKYKELLGQLNQISGAIDEYRNKKVQIQSEYENVQEHLAKLREELQKHRRYIKMLKQNQVQRIVVDFDSHKKVLQKINTQLKDLS